VRIESWRRDDETTFVDRTRHSRDFESKVRKSHTQILAQ
jgi:hypothetical protein